MRGRDKLLEIIEGEALLCRQTNAALATGLNVHVLIRPGDAERKNSLPVDPRLEISTVPDADEGMAATLRHAATMVADQSMLILLPDVPGIRTEDIQSVLLAFAYHRGKMVVRASDAEGHPGTPICLPAKVVAQFSKLEGDEGGQKLLKKYDVELIRFDNDRATRDLNTPEDWANWRADQTDL
jgi:molybdenum cofactor cytidylyltransferase